MPVDASCSPQPCNDAVATTFYLPDRNSSGGLTGSAAGALTLLNTNGVYNVPNIGMFPFWDPNGANFDSAMQQIGMHEAGHGFGLGDQTSLCGDVMSAWGPASASNPSGGTNNQGGCATPAITACDDQEIQNDPNGMYVPPGGGECTIDSSCMSIEACLGCDEECQCTGINPHSPIILDLGRNGYDLTDLQHGVRFDLDNDGRAGLTAWTAPHSNSGFLALDKNRNGMIDNGDELFGNSTRLTDGQIAANGWDALAAYDRPENGGNGDGIINPNDRIWSELLIWVDSNHDGLSQPAELHALSELGIDAISLDYHQEGRSDRYGNYFRYRSLIYGHNPNGAVYRSFAFDVYFAGVRGGTQGPPSSQVKPGCAPKNRSILTQSVTQRVTK